MGNLARFTVNGTASDPPGFDATPSLALTFRLEAPSGVMNRWTLQVFDSTVPDSPDASKSAPAISLVGATTGTRVDAATPTSAITSTAPSTRAHSYTVRSFVNGGINALGQEDPDYVFERIISIRTADGRRKIVADEETQYSQRGLADAQNELVDALSNTTPLLMVFANATTRRAQPLTVADLGRRGLQLDTAKIWDVVPSLASPGTYTWGDDDGPEVTFTGNFLTVLPGAFQIMVSDQGVTNGSTIVRADQSGNGYDYSATGHNPTVASTLNGRATLLFSGTQRMGSLLALASPASVPWEMVMACKLNAYTAGGRLISDSTAELIYQSGSPGITLYGGAGGPTTADLTTGGWKLVKARATDSASNLIQAGNGAAVTGAGATMGATSGWAIAADPAGGNESNIEIALVAFGPVGFAGAPFLAALDVYYNSLVQHP